MNDVTRMLEAVNSGDRAATDELLALVYDELRQMAAAKLAHERAGHSLEATALVHEVYLRLMAEDRVQQPAERARWANSRHFYAAAAQAMQRILVDNARRRRRLKRGGGQTAQTIEACEPVWPEPREDLVALDEALARLAGVDPQAAELVRLRFFLGYALLDAAEILRVSPRTAYRLWSFARAWLHREIQAEEAAERTN